MTDYGMGEDTLVKAADMVRNAKADFDRLAGQLEGQIQGLQGRWAGQGGRAFFQVHQAWSEKQRIVVKALDDFEQSLVSTDKDAKATDEASSSSMANINSRLG